MPSTAPIRSALFTALAITLTSALAHAQPAAIPPATQPAAKPAASQPATPPLTPEQQKILATITNTKPDVAAPKYETKPFNKDGTPNPNFGKVQAGFQATHEAFLKRKASPIGVLFLGDSITAGWNKAIWTERYSNLQPANFGISGDRTEHVLWRIENGELDGISPKVVVLMIGTNNSGNSAPNITAGVTAIVKQINQKLPNSKLLLLGIFPRGLNAKTADGKPDPTRAKLAQINAELAKLDDGKKNFFLDITDKFLDEKGTLSKDIMPDGLHPNAKGYQIWADAMQPKLDELLK
jgi:lysophospholipase L1-like esterase